MKKKGMKNQTKKSSEERVTSGIPGFDYLIEGGFEKNSVNLIVGGSGSAKSIFSVQFLVEGIKRGEKCLYITFEEKKTEFYSNMLEFGWDLSQLEKEGKFIFLEYTPEKVKVMLEEGGGSVESIVIKNKIQRIVIDSITSFALLFEQELEKREAALSLFDIIRKWSCTSLLTLQENPGEREDGSVSSMEFESDSIVLLYFARKGSKRERFIEVLKMRGTKHSTEIHPFEITKQGITVSKNVCRNCF